ncbi:hypothetical protein Goari_000689 [Gossypium aridum]|uniref:Uncharacterized protein n=1 Tax=Gossypium aridum TaxID=34290 RepID=A0A7J8YHG9_GOSAI|nr:hypothetical protein [Gossypium aridum]
MEKILERYERYSYAERQLVATEPESQVQHAFHTALHGRRIRVIESQGAAEFGAAD